MHVCMYVYLQYVWMHVCVMMFVYMCESTYVCLHICIIYVCVCVYIYMYICVYIYMCILCVYIYIYVYIYELNYFLFIYIYIYVYMYILYICVYMCVCIYIYIYTELFIRFAVLYLLTFYSSLLYTNLICWCCTASRIIYLELTQDEDFLSFSQNPWVRTHLHICIFV